MLVAIINHECTANAIALKKAFSLHETTVLIDSGSRISEKNRPHFDVLLPNVYYAGLLNHTYNIMVQTDQRWLLLICSDVTIADVDNFVNILRQSITRFHFGIIAPAIARKSHHRQMVVQPGQAPREVPFVDGYCLAIRREILDRLCPIDTSINQIGWGIETHLGLIAKQLGLRAVVHDAILVEHTDGSGYAHTEARQQRADYFSHVGWDLRLYWRLTERWWMKNTAWERVIRFLPWRMFACMRGKSA